MEGGSMTVNKLSFTYDEMKRNPGDRIRAEDWNKAMQAIANLGEIGATHPQGRLTILTAAQTGTGTVTGTNSLESDISGFQGSPINGNGTSFLNQLRVGDHLTAAGQTRVVVRVDSDTKLYVDSAFYPPIQSEFTFARPVLLVKDGSVGIGAPSPQGQLEISIPGHAETRPVLSVKDGQVGIATSTPQGLLDVSARNKGTGVITGANTWDMDNTGFSGSPVSGSGTLFLTQLRIGDQITANRQTRTIIRIDSDTKLYIDTPFGFPLPSSTAFTFACPVLLVKDGNVGIGVWNATEKLEVDGAIKATRFIGDGSGLTGIQGAGGSQWIAKTDNTGISYSAGTVTIGAANKGATLQILNKNQDASGDTFILGRTDGSHLRLGYHADYSWLQSGSGRPLAINPLGGNVGIGTLNPRASLHIKQPCAGADQGLLLEETDASGDSTGRWMNIYYEGQGTVVFYHQNGQGQFMTPDGNWHLNSDRSLKENIVPLHDILDKVMRLTPVSFQWRSSKSESLGFVAQEVEQIFPELVNSVTLEDKAVKGLPYPLFGVLAIAALQELAASLNQRIQELSSIVTALANTR
jgi:hypothetical protein